MKNPSQALLQALAVTAEICGTDLSEAAAKVMCADLSGYPEQAVLDALVRLRREHQGRLTLAAIVSRIDDGRPGTEEAWSLSPKDEADSAVVTNEMQLAMGSAWPLIQDGDRIAARMAFKEAYEKIVANNRANGTPLRWEVSLGFDVSGREAALVEAVQKNRISVDHAMRCLPSSESHERFLASVGATDHPLLAPPSNKQKANLKRLKNLTDQLKIKPKKRNEEDE